MYGPQRSAGLHAQPGLHCSMPDPKCTAKGFLQGENVEWWRRWSALLYTAEAEVVPLQRLRN